MGGLFLILETIEFIRDLILLTSYVGSGTFPQPLSPEEEEKYLKLRDQGDREARNVLIERNLRLVAHVVKKYDQSGVDVEDLISIGTVGLIKAINTFSRDKGTRLATYAARCIENEILMHLRASKKTRAEIFLHDPIGVDKEGNEITLLDVLTSDAESVPSIIESKAERKKLWEKIRNLQDREKRVLELRYGLSGDAKKTQREIARILGISRSYVSRIEKRAITRLSQDFDARP